MRTRPRTYWIAFLLLALLAAGAAAPRTTSILAAGPAQANCTGACKIFLPIVSRAQLAPSLNNPIGGTQVDSVAPPLTWTSAITGTRYTIQVATSSDFISGTFELSTTKILSEPAVATQVTIPRSNFKSPATYYWRVGVYLPDGIHYSPTEQFSTPTLDTARYAAPPQYLSPPNCVRLTSDAATLVWAAAPSALAYRVRIINPDGTSRVSGILEVPQTSYDLSNLLPHEVYQWQVRVYNGYGWGDYGPTWRFRTL